MNKAKKVISLVLSLMLAVSCFTGLATVTAFADDTASADTATEGVTVYLDAENVEKGDEVWYAWTWGTTNGTWVNADKTEESIYRFDNVEENVIFVRMNAEAEVLPSWDACWNQTNDLTAFADATFAAVSYADGSNKILGDWVVEPATVDEPAADPATGDEVDNVYSIAGSSAAIFGMEWTADNAATDMTYADGLFAVTFTDVQPADGVQFKVVVNHSWDESYGDNGNNVVFNVTEACDVTITFDADSKEINVIGDYAYIVKELKFDALRAVGNGEGNWLNGVNWNPAADENVMTKIADGVYAIYFEGVEAYAEYEAKFAADGGWAVNWGCDIATLAETQNVYEEDGATYYTAPAKWDGNNIPVITSEDWEDDENTYTVTLTLDLRDFDFTSKEGAVFTIKVEKDVTEPATDDEPATGDEPATDPATGDEPATDPATGDEPATDPATGDEPATPDYPVEGKLGDIDGDGVSDVRDATIILEATVELVTLTPEQEVLADVNKDGYVDARDATSIMMLNVELIRDFSEVQQ